jgi:acetyltransferase
MAGPVEPGAFPLDPPRPLRLRDGHQLTLRPLTPEDEARVVRFHGALSAATVQWRWFHAMGVEQRTAHQRLMTVCRNDPARDLALVACDEQGEIAAIGRLARVGMDAELAVVVADAWQRHGVGGQLVDALVGAAWRAGCARVVLAMLPDNAEMERLARRHGFACRLDRAEGVVRGERTRPET